MRLAVIPARGGSKRIPRKNIRHFFGKPIIGWSILVAIQAKCFDRIVVSTDDEEIADVARGLGAEAPFRRPPSLADDHTPTAPVIAHAIRAMSEAGHHPDLVCCIYPTAPLLQAEDVQAGLELMQSSSWDFCVSVTRFTYPIQRALRRTEQGAISLFQPETQNVRSQDLEPAYHDAGQFYWGRTSAWLDGRPVFGHNSCSVLLPRQGVQDIDTEEDWELAEHLFAARQHALASGERDIDPVEAR